jgi:hypothetical protein
MNNNKLIQLNGRVKYIHRGSFSVQEYKDGKLYGNVYRCVGSYLLLVSPGDIFSGYVEVQKIKDDLVAKMVSEPIVLIPNDINSVKMQLLHQKSLKLNETKVQHVWDVFTKYAMDKEEKRLLKSANEIKLNDNIICSYFDRAAQECDITYPSIKGINPIPEQLRQIDNVENIISWTNKQRNRRRLWLLGLTNRDINESNMDLIELYTKLITKPLTVVNLPTTKCENIMLRTTGKKPSEQELIIANVARKLYQDVTTRGHTGTNCYRLIKDFPNLGACLSSLSSDYNVIVDPAQQILYLPFQAYVEDYIAQHIAKALKSNKPVFKLSEKYQNSQIKQLDEKEILSLTQDSKGLDKTGSQRSVSDDQRKAILLALNNRFSIIDGRAGTGKTTSIKALASILKQLKIEYHICAFTGQAASRIKKVTKEDATTIHRFIARNRDSDGIQVIIIDEFSMVSAELMYKLMLCGGSEGVAFVAFGDSNQLPPIEWGSIMNQLITVPMVPRYTLVQNHRMYKVQGEVDYILLNANNIVDNVISGIDSKFHFIPGNNFLTFNADINFISEMLKSFKQQGVNKDHITIITPYIEYIQPLNKMFQDIFFADIDTKNIITDYKNVKWCVGDRIMALENDYNKNVMNGETGTVIDVCKSEVTIRFEEGDHTFQLPQDPKDILTAQFLASQNGILPKEPELDTQSMKQGEKGLTYSKLIHAFCATTHKLQGSEQEYCIFFCPQRPNSGFLNKNLLYTSLTRAKRCMYIVGDIKTIETAAQRKLPYRCETLATRINILCPPTEEMLKANNVVKSNPNQSAAQQVEDCDADYAPYDYGMY